MLSQSRTAFDSHQIHLFDLGPENAPGRNICFESWELFSQALNIALMNVTSYKVPDFSRKFSAYFVLTSWFVHFFQPNSHESAIHTSVEGKGSLIREAELDLAKPSPKPKYPPPPGNPGLQQHPTVDSSTIISDSSLMGMVLKRSEEVMEALLVNRFHLRGVENFFRFKSLQPKPKPRPAPKAHYPPPPRSPLATTKARPAPQGYPPAPKTPLADVYQQLQNSPAKINGLEKM